LGSWESTIDHCISALVLINQDSSRRAAGKVTFASSIWLVRHPRWLQLQLESSKQRNKSTQSGLLIVSSQSCRSAVLPCQRLATDPMHYLPHVLIEANDQLAAVTGGQQQQ